MIHKKKLLLSVIGFLFAISLFNSAYADAGPDPERDLTAACQPEPGAPDQHNCYHIFSDVPMGAGLAYHLVYMTCAGTFNHAVDFSSTNSCITWTTTGGSTDSSIHRNSGNQCWKTESTDITLKCSDQ